MGGRPRDAAKRKGRQMPKETFWDSATAVEGDNSEPILTVAWHKDCPCEQTFVALNGVKFDSSGITRLIGVLRKANKQAYGPVRQPLYDPDMAHDHAGQEG